MKVIVLGGGVAGLSAAHELAERDIEVVVYEARAIPGGKARSLPVPRSGKRGRGDLPAEHGFRFFPGFYRHLPDTMKRIPYRGQADGVLGNLVPTREVQLALEGRAEIVTPAHFPSSLDDLGQAFESLLAQATTLGIPARDQARFVNTLLLLLTSCEERRFAEFEHQSWWEFSGAQTRSPEYGKFLADGLTRTLVAAKAREMSARTGGSILLQLLFDLARPGRQVDRVLNGPTNDVWIDPWLDHLRSLGVDYRAEHQVQAIHTRGDSVSHVSVVANGRSLDDAADFYVAAVPVEVMRLLATDEIKQAEPQLAGLNALRTRWMNGVMFYLDRDVPVVHGHSLYIDSLWALTSISQRQFWPEVDFTAAAGQYGRLVAPSAGGDDGDREPRPRLRLRSHPHRPGHHGRGQRGGAAGRERDSRASGLHPAPLSGVAPVAAGDLCSRPGARPDPVRPPPPARAPGHPLRRRQDRAIGAGFGRRLARWADLAAAVGGDGRRR
jgi:uncharacterized protein with NAD-binding domain and iron-sulfur cluster